MRANARQQTKVEQCGEQLCTFKRQVPNLRGHVQLLECVHDKQSCLENVALPACLAMLSTSIGYDDVIAGPSRYTLVAFHTAEVVP